MVGVFVHFRVAGVSFPHNLLELSRRQIVGKVDTRNARTIQSSRVAGVLHVTAFLLNFFVWCRTVEVSFFSDLIADFSDLTEKMRDQLGKKKIPKVSSRDVLHKTMLRLHILFACFIAGPKCGLGSFCTVYKRDVAMEAHGSGEF